MKHYIGYNKIEDWGEGREGGSTFQHWSARPRQQLEKMIGQTVWVVSGQRVARSMVYKLCHAYEPNRIRSTDGGYWVAGSGVGFVPHMDVTYSSWLPELLREQSNFRFGLNQIRSRPVIRALDRLRAAPVLDGFPGDLTRSGKFWEGAQLRIVVNAYERNPQARAACLAHHGVKCVVCGFDFAAQYGELGSGVIHVHHLKQMSDVRRRYRINPIKDLRPVCPNCHTIIHRRAEPLSIDDARLLVRRRFR